MANTEQETAMTKKKLNDLRVVDLRMELEKRGLDKTGVKTALVERLTKTLQEEGLDPEEHLFEVALEGGSPSVKKVPIKRSGRKLGKENELQGMADGQEDLDDDKGESEDEKDELSMEVDNKEEEELNETSAHTEKEQTDTTEGKSGAGDTGKEKEADDKDISSAATQGSSSKQDSSDKTASSTTETSTTAKAKSTGVKEIKVISRNEKGEKVRRVLVSSRSLWVSGLASTTRAADLKNLFSKHGKVIGAKIVTNAKTPGARCYGFVTMSTSKEASVCIQHLHRTELNGRMISVERTKKDSSAAAKKTDAKTLVTRKRALGVGRTLAGKKKLEKGAASDGKKDEAESENKGEEQVDGKGEEAEKGEKKSKENEKLRRRRSRSRSREIRRTFGGRLRGRGFAFRGRGRGFAFRRPFGGSRGSFFGRPGFSSAKPSLLTFQKIREERMRQRQREKEREIREVERRRTQAFFRQKEIEHKHREEAFRLERERERLRIEREKLERERAEVLRLEREKQRLERERLEREKEELRRQQLSRVGRVMKRPYEGRGSRDAEPFWEERKRPMMARREKQSSYAEGSNARFQDFNRNRVPYERREPNEKRDRFEGRAKPLDVAARGNYGGAGGREVLDHVERRDGGRVERTIQRDQEIRDSRRDTFDRERFGMSDRRVTRENWKPKPRDSRGFEMTRERPDRYVSGGKAMMGGRSFANGGRSYDRGGESWESGQGDRDMGKSFNSGMMGSQWGSSSKGDSWGRMESSQGDRWGGNVGASVESRHIRGQQGMGPQTGMGHQNQSGMYGNSGPMGGMMSGISGGFGGDRYSVPIIRRY